MIKATSGEPPREFTVPPDIRFETVDPVSGEIAGQWTQRPVKVALRSSQDAAAQPDESATNKADEHIIEETDRPAVQTLDKSGTEKSSTSILEKAEQPTIQAEDNSAIKEEDLPPE
jgi:hypothetical protein